MAIYRRATANGYDVVGLVQKDNGAWVVLGRKEKQYSGVEYVVGNNYSLADGTWGSGTYVTDYAAAMEIFTSKITNTSNTVWVVEYETSDNCGDTMVFKHEGEAKDNQGKLAIELVEDYKENGSDVEAEYEYGNYTLYFQNGDWAASVTIRELEVM